MKNSGVEWIGEIPDEWDIYRNKNAFICNKEIVGKNSNSTQLLSLTTGGIKCKDINNAEGKLPESFDTYQYVKKNDVVMCLFDLDMSAVFSGISQYDGMISPAYKVLSCQDRANPLFIHYWFSYIFDGRKFNHYAKNIRYTLNYNEFATLPILLPPKSTQQHIASYLDKKCSKIEETIQNQQQVIEKLKAYKQSLITEAVTGKIKIENGKACGEYESYKDSGVEWIGKIPSEWNLTKIAYITTKIGSGKTPNGGAAIYIDEGVLFIRSQNVYNEGLLLDEPMFISDEIDDDMKSTRLANNDVLLNITGGSIGRCCIYEKKYGRANVNQHVCIIRVIPTKVIPKFMQLFWISKVGEISIDIYQTGGNREGMSGDAISKTLIPLPSMNEQKEIADYLDKKCTAIDTAIEQKQELIVKLTEYKKSLIYECVTGKKEI